METSAITSVDTRPNRFEVKQTIEQTPLEEEPVRKFLDEWCRINDSIVPQIASRTYWEQHVEKQGLLSKATDGRTILFIPLDLHLWEMLPVVEAIDKDTFAKKPEIWQKKKQQLQEFGKTFRNSGIYLAQRIDTVQEGKPVAEELAREFFSYGNSLITGIMDNSNSGLSMEKIALNPITSEDTEKIDRWLAGDKLYESRMRRMEAELNKSQPEKVDNIIEEARRSTLKQFFRVAEKAFLLNNQNDSNPKLFHNRFIQRLKERIQKNIDLPKKELYDSLFRRGLEKLVNEIRNPKLRIVVIKALKTSISFPKFVPDAKLIDFIQLDQLKTELQEIKESGDVKRTSEKELEVVKKIQAQITNYLFKDDVDNPFEIISTNQMNCLGRTMLTGMLLREVGITYLPVNVPRHAVVFVITSDKRVFWEDMTKPYLSGELKDTDIVGKKPSGENITTSDIVAFSKNPEGILFFDLTSQKYKEKLPWAIRNEHPIKYVRLLPPETGEKLMLINNTINNLIRSGQFDVAIEMLKLSRLEGTFNLAIYNDAFNQVGDKLRDAGRYKEAIKLYQQILPSVNAYNGLGNTFLLLENYPEAINMYKNAIALNPNSPHPYNGMGYALREMHLYKDTLVAFEKFVALADGQKKYDSFVKSAKKEIEELRKILQ